MIIFTIRLMIFTYCNLAKILDQSKWDVSLIKQEPVIVKKMRDNSKIKKKKFLKQFKWIKYWIMTPTVWEEKDLKKYLIMLTCKT